MSNPSRRQVLAVGAATLSLPMLQAAVGSMRTARANPAGGAAAGGAATRPGQAPAEKAGWFTTTVKPADLKDGEFVAVKDHAILLSCKEKEIVAYTAKCTHQGCDLSKMAKAGQKTITCGCHGAQFNLDGTVAKAPARNPLARYAIRTSKDGVIEIDPGSNPKAGEENASIKAA